MDNIDEILKEKEKELREYQSLKLKSLETKLLQQNEHILSLEQKIQDLNIISHAKDLELNDSFEKTRKYKQQIEENLHKISHLSDENSKNQAKLIEKDRELCLYKSEIDNLSLEITSLNRKTQETYSNHDQEIKHLTYLNIELEKNYENLKNDLSKTISSYESLETTYKTLLHDTKCENLHFTHEENELRQNLKEILTERDFLKETNENLIIHIKSLNEKSITQKRKLKKLKEKNQDFEFKIHQILDENNAKSLQIRHKFEQELRTMQTQYEMKDIQLRSLIEEKAKCQDKLIEMERLKYEGITQIERNLQESQHKIIELTLNNQSKELELTKHKQEAQIQLENTTNTLKNTQEKLQELEKNARLFYQKAQELEKENNLLIQEVVAYRKNQISNKNSPTIRISPNRKISKEIFNIDDFKHPPEKGLINEENEVHSMLFSDDMGPATPLKGPSNKDPILKQSLKKSNFLSKSSEIELKKRIKELEGEKKDYKRIIENLAEEMQNVKDKLQMSQQFKQDNILRIKLLEKELDDKGELLIIYEKENKALKKEIEELGLENNDYKRLNSKITHKVNSLLEERSKLIEISQKLHAKVRVFEEEDEYDSFCDDDNKYSRKIRLLQEKMMVLEQEIIKWKDIEIKKNDLIEQLKKKIGDSHKNPYILSEYEKIGGFDEELDRFKEKLNEIQAEINREMRIEAKKKPLIIRNEENLDKNLLYQRNSEKETESQKKIEEKLQTKRKSPKTIPKARNYNIKN